MSDLQRQFRDLLVAHANHLARAQSLDSAAFPSRELPGSPAAAWLTTHRLHVLRDHPDLIPALRDHLTQLRRRTLAQNIVLIRAFTDVVHALSAGDGSPRPIPVAPLKGIALLDTVYSADIGLRPMTDLDLLVPEDRIEQAIARLAPLGYAEPEPSHRLRRVMHHRALRGPRAILELHTKLGQALVPRSTWRHVDPCPATVHGVPAHRLSPAAELVHLLIHFYLHRPFTVLGWLDEILSLAHTLPAEDQEHTIPAVASRLLCRTPLAITVELLRRTLGPGFLPHLHLADLHQRSARTSLHRWVFLDPPDPLRPMVKRSQLLEELHAALLVDRLTDGLRDIARMAAVHVLARFPTRI